MPEDPYTLAGWLADLEALGREFSVSGQGDAESIQRYTRWENPQNVDEADRRAVMLEKAFAFLFRHRQALADAKILGAGATEHPNAVVVALYEWFTMPWVSALPPDPSLEAIIKMARGEV